MLFLVVLVLFGGVGLFFFFKLKEVDSDLEKLSQKVAVQEEMNREKLYKDHLKHTENIQLASQASQLEEKLSELSEKDENEEYLRLKEIYDLYDSVSRKLDRNQDAEIDTSSYLKDLDSLGNLLLEKEFGKLKETLESSAANLDRDYEDYLASLPPPEPTPQDIKGYSLVNVDTGRGSFGVHLIKISLANVSVVTSAASDGDCDNDCPVKPLDAHVGDSGGFAGINGPYFCPPDYESCADKVNSTDFAFYNSRTGQWLNKDALSWGKTGLATFEDHSADFYRKSSDYSGGGISAGVSNYPTLLSNGNIVVDTGDLTSYQTDNRGPRGAIGVDGGGNLYLAIVSGATVPEAAYAMKALGVTDALNLDGGGSSALYINGSYVVGPGRELPNAVVLK